MPDCPTEESLDTYRTGSCPEAEKRRIESHLAGCADCREWLEEARANDAILPDVRRAALDGPAPAASAIGGDPPDLGRYRIIRRLGGGGMGIVYEAEQLHPRRTVALKVLAPGMASPDALRRFELEAELLGRLHHPGIAQIFEAGTFDAGSGPQPFFAMEMVRGKPLDEHAREGGLDLDGRLELIIEVCRAVHHAHLSGIVHRDLKPANILVAESGEPKVLDFGVARATGADVRRVTLRTEIGRVLGTLPYMSPEQLRGDPGAVDIRTDVYSLGVVLHELLAGETPHDLTGKPLAEAVRIVEEVNPLPLEARRPELRGDIATIVSKALEKDRERRYASAADLAADLERCRRHEPILARPPSTAYLIRKFLRRNRIAVASAAAIFALLAAGLLVTAHLLVRARAAESDARTAEGEWKKAAAEATKAADLAERKKLEAQREARDANAARDFLQEVLMLADPSERLGGPPTLEAVIEEASRRVDRDLAKHENVQAGIHHTLGQVYRRLSNLEKAEAHLEKALAMYVRIHGREHHLVGYVLTNLAQLRYYQGRYDEAEALCRRVLDMRGVMRGKFLRELATAAMNIGHAHYGRGDFAAAERAMRDSLELYREHDRGEGPDSAINIGNLAVMVAAQGRHAEAEELFRRAIRLKSRVMGPRNAFTGISRTHFAGLLEEMGNLGEAEKEARAALGILREAYGENDPWVGSCLRALGQILRAAGRGPEGVEHLRRALAIHRGAHPQGHQLVVRDLEALGSALAGLGEREEAERLLSEAAAMGDKLLGEGHPLSLRSRRFLGLLLADAGRLEEAAAHLERFIELAPAGAPWAERLLPEAKEALARCREAAEADPAPGRKDGADRK